MTLAFFMFAGRLPVLMFSFMIRTLVSFCSQEPRSHNTDTLERTPQPRTAPLSRPSVHLSPPPAVSVGTTPSPTRVAAPVSKPLIVLPHYVTAGAATLLFLGSNRRAVIESGSSDPSGVLPPGSARTYPELLLQPDLVEVGGGAV